MHRYFIAMFVALMSVPAMAAPQWMTLPPTPALPAEASTCRHEQPIEFRYEEGGACPGCRLDPAD
jgi:hypothetical protein